MYQQELVMIAKMNLYVRKHCTKCWGVTIQEGYHSSRFDRQFPRKVSSPLEEIWKGYFFLFVCNSWTSSLLYHTHFLTVHSVKQISQCINHYRPGNLGVPLHFLWNKYTHIHSQSRCTLILRAFKKMLDWLSNRSWSLWSYKAMAYIRHSTFHTPADF